MERKCCGLDQNYSWSISFWSFLCACKLMRGILMLRVISVNFNSKEWIDCFYRWNLRLVQMTSIPIKCVVRSRITGRSCIMRVWLCWDKRNFILQPLTIILKATVTPFPIPPINHPFFNELALFMKALIPSLISICKSHFRKPRPIKCGYWLMSFIVTLVKIRRWQSSALTLPRLGGGVKMTRDLNFF